MQIETVEQNDAEWDAFVNASDDCKIYHLTAFRRIIENSFGHRTIYLRAKGSDGRTAGILPLVHMHSRIFGNFLVSVPFFNYGGVAGEAEARRALLEEAVHQAKRRGASHIELRHVESKFTDLQSKSHKVSMMLDLPDSADVLWKAFKSKLRSQIRRPEKEGITAKVGREALLDDFYSVFSVNMRDLGTPVYSRRLFANVLRELPDRSWIVAAYKDQVPVAAGFLLGYRDTMEIPWASSLRRYNRLAPNMLMYWHALQHAINEGFRKFDFGRSTPNEGTYKFKAQWGAQPVALHWEYWLANGGPLPDISPKNGKYEKFIRIWQKLPVPVTQVIGPSIVKNIP